VKFKNDLEKQVYERARRVCEDSVSIEHNKTVQIENTMSPEVASFVGPPKKEIDVITANLAELALLISCKDFGGSKAEPAHVQEWVAVVNTMNTYSAGTKYLGMIVSPSGFTSGCEPWASAHNLGLIPPLKGKKLTFTLDSCLQMVERVLKGLDKRLKFPHADFYQPPMFYEFVYKMTESFEGRDQASEEYGNRYTLIGTGWMSSFSELVRMFKGKTIQSLQTTSAGIYLTFSDGLAFAMLGTHLQFGPGPANVQGESIELKCEKNFAGEPCSIDFLKATVIGNYVTSAGDWGDRFEFGLSDDLMLAIEPGRLHVYRTRNPIDNHLL
jgi:hypothetical protein